MRLNTFLAVVLLGTAYSFSASAQVFDTRFNRNMGYSKPLEQRNYWAPTYQFSAFNSNLEGTTEVSTDLQNELIDLLIKSYKNGFHPTINIKAKSTATNTYTLMGGKPVNGNDSQLISLSPKLNESGPTVLPRLIESLESAFAKNKEVLSIQVVLSSTTPLGKAIPEESRSLLKRSMERFQLKNEKIALPICDKVW